MNQRWADWALLWLRALSGAGMATHGFAKIFGGGMERFSDGVAGMGFPFPAVFAWAAALSEFLGGILLAVGLWAAPAAVFIFITMSVAFFIAHRNDPFSTREMAYLYWAITGALAVLGPGRYTLEKMIRRGK